MQVLLRWTALACSIWLCGAVSARATDQVDYLRDVKPLLAKHCYACHGALKQEAGLRLDTAEFMRTGGDSGAAVTAGAPDESALLDRVSSSDDSLRMPPEGKPLTAGEIELLKKWIAGGATAPADEAPQADPLQHWSFQPPKKNPLPENVAAHPIDRFLLASAEKLEVQPLGPASKRVLLRRVMLDLVGLPPTPEQIEQFVRDPSPTAYENVVVRLLDAPEYGERWGRHWMDVWRYSDWYGRRSVPDVMNSYPQIWRWRDWIVRSLNNDKGYDRMVMEMVAADELAPLDQENIVATGFIVRNWFKWNYETWMKDSVEHTGKAFLGLTLNCAQCHDHKFDPITQEDYFRFRAFFEPLELRHERVAGEPDPGPFQKYDYAKSYGPIQSGAIRMFDEKLDAQTFMFSGGDARNRIPGKPPVEPGPPRAFMPESFKIEPIDLPAEAAYPGLKDFVRRDEMQLRDAELSAATQTLKAAELALTSTEEKLARLQLESVQPVTASSRPAAGELLAAEQNRADAQRAKQIAEAAVDVANAKRHALAARIAADDAAYRQIGDATELAQVASLAEKQVAFQSAQHARLVAEQQVIAAERAAATSPADKLEAAKAAAATATQQLQAATTAVDAARAKLAVIETTYAPLSPKYPDKSTGRRTALAKWLASTDNPLTARVAVNHMWLRHFGQPLVESVDNFGLQGKRPLHPELLDWLAVEFMSHQWSMKHLHRLIVTSAAYRRASSTADSGETRDKNETNTLRDRDNTTYWRFPARRMEAEVVRDSVLACAGALDRTPGGREIELADWIKNPRRSLYFTQHGEAQMLFLNTFDGANVCECYRRTSTVLPSQALAMSNSELLVHYGRIAAQRLSQKLAAEPESSSLSVEALDERFTRLAFDTILSRPASDKELAASLNFLQEQRSLLATIKQPEAPASADASVQAPSPDPTQRARENLVMALFNHNDFVTIR